MSFSNWTFVFNFKDPATLYAHSLMSVHHDVMWYIILIVTIVCWTLYKILKEFGWNAFNKQVGFLRFSFLSRTFVLIESFLVFIWIKVFSLFASVAYLFISYANKITFLSDLTNKFSIFSFIGSEYFTGFRKASWANSPKLTFAMVSKLTTEKYLDYLLFSATTLTYYYYDEEFPGANSFLTVQKFKHSTAFEFVWAIFPTMIILLILVPSMLLLYSLDEDLDPKLTIKVVGHQWFWSYEFDNWLELENGDFEYVTYDFDSSLVVEDYLTLGDKRLLEVDKPLIVPVNVTLRFLITSADVLHAWSVPELGIKIDAVPGRLSQYLSLIRRPGFFYGQCSEICGVAHGFMPIVVLAI